MLHIDIQLDGDGAWPELHTKGYEAASLSGVARLVGGMASGNPSVALRIETADGRTFLAQTSMALFLGAARALSAAEERDAELAASRKPS